MVRAYGMNDKVYQIKAQNCEMENRMASMALCQCNADTNVSNMHNSNSIEAVSLVNWMIDLSCSIGPTRNVML